MKKLFPIFILLLCCFAATAQNDNNKVSRQHSNVRGGVRIGLTTSQISGDDLRGYHQFGGYAGL